MSGAAKLGRMILLFSTVVCFLTLAATLAAAPRMERVSVSGEGAEGDGECLEVALSPDGRYVAFSSRASNLVSGDANGAWDIFVRDRVAGTTERVSITSGGKEANGDSGRPALSADGRYVAFVSDASNLVSGDTNEKQDVFVRDRQDGKTERASIGSDGAQGDEDSGWFPAISADGRYVVFVSLAKDLVADDENNRQDVFVRDRLQGTTERVSVGSDGTEGIGISGWLTSISADGRYVAFSSTSPDLLPESEDTNGKVDVFVRDRATGKTERVSIPAQGGEADGDCALPVISADGRFVAFVSAATNLVAGDKNGMDDVFVRDRVAGKTLRVSVGSDGEEANAQSEYCSISADGRWVAFHSAASNLVEGDANEKRDVFLRNLKHGKTLLVSEAASGKPGDGDSVGPVISAEGSMIAFLSSATDLVEQDGNGADDIFLRTIGEGP